MTDKSQACLLFDGYCNLCDGFVSFLMQRDSAARFEFIPLQSEEGIALLAKAGLSPTYVDSVVLIESGRARIKSDAALRALEILGGIWTIAKLLRIFPTGLRDFVYDRIARLRYRIFGKKLVCDLTRRRKAKPG